MYVWFSGKERNINWLTLCARTLNIISTASNRVTYISVSLFPSSLLIHQHEYRAEFSTLPQAQVNPSGLNFPVVWSYEKLV